MNENYSKLVDIAYNMHTSGKFEEARLVYEKLMSVNPDDLNVKNLYAQLCVSLNDYDTALELFDFIYNKTKLVDIKISIAQIYFLKKMYKNVIATLKDVNIENLQVLNMLSTSHMREKDYISAAKFLKRLIDLQPENFLNYYNLSLCLKFLNNNNESLEFALKAYSIKSDDIDILLHIASLYDELKDINNAITYLEKIIAIRNDEDVLYRLGVLNKKIGNYYKAVSLFDKVIQINPNNKNAMLNIAFSYKSIDMKNAIEIYKDIQKIYPDDLSIPFYIYNVYYEIFDFENALKVALDLIKRKPNDYVYYLMAGDCYFELFEYEKSIDMYKTAIQIDPNNNDLKSSLAYAYYSNGNLELACELLNSINCHDNTYTLLHLKKQDLDSVTEGYIHWCSNVKDFYDSNKKARKFFHKLNIAEKYGITEETFSFVGTNKGKNRENLIVEFYKKNMNITDDYTNKNVLIYVKHGVGDFIMFARYINKIKEKAKNVILYIPKSLERLVRYNFPEFKIFLKGENISSDLYDYSIPEMVSICYSDSNLKNIPYSNGYINVDDKLVMEKSTIEELNISKKKIGIFWQGNPTVLFNRSMKLREFIPLFDLENVQFYSFQLSHIDDDSANLMNELNLINLAPYIKDYFDTAALLKNIDLLITIDTSIANLAGAMGIKTFLLLPYDSEWRWFTDENITPWYDSVRIFKQRRPKDWQEVIQRVKNEI